MGAVHFHHTGSVSATDFKDVWKRDYNTNKCTYEVKHTGDNGKFRFVVKYKKWYYGRRGAAYKWWWDWEKLVKITLEPGEHHSGSFTGVPDHLPSATDYPPFDADESMTEFKISVKWIFPTPKAEYDVKVEFLLP